MARFSSVLLSLAFAAASLSVAAAQTTRPAFPLPRPQPNANQQAQPNPQQQMPPAVNRTVPVNQPVAPIKPSPTDPPANTPPTTPATPPVVTYRDGLLTVQASNSTLASVINAIRSKTGIEFEGTPEGASDRVALSVGPAPAGEVLSTIFAGSKFDFVALGRPDDPGIVQRVIMTPKSQAGAAAGAQMQPQPRPNDNGEGGDPDENPDEQVNVEPQDTAAQPPPQQQQPQEQPQQQQPKTPEQLLQELQEMRKQQQMQQEGAPPPNPAQVPRKPPL